MTRKIKQPKSKTDKIRRDVRVLKEHLPALLPVKVYLRQLKDELGYCYLASDDAGNPSHFIVAIEKRITYDAMWQVLIHEWAHARSWRPEHPNCSCEDHGPEWALELAKVYQETVSW